MQIVNGLKMTAFLINYHKNMTYFIHEKAIVESNKIGDDSRIWAFVHILSGAEIGKNANICDHCFIENDVLIGDNVTIKCGVYIWDGMHIEDNVFVGPSVTFANDRYPRSKNPDFKKERTLLKEGCSIGANATLLPGITIGQYAIVGAGSVVTKDVPNHALTYGNPGKIHGYVCKCGKQLSFDTNMAQCECGKSYIQTASEVQLKK